MKNALIFGISGQDGAYLAKLLLDKGYKVFGTSRDALMSSFHNLDSLGIKDRVDVLSMTPIDFRSVIQTLLNTEPDEVYNLAGLSSVGLSFEHPMETLESIACGTLNILEAIRMVKPSIRFYNACSGECFGDTGGIAANESTPFAPRSPYGVAKATSFWQVANYREAYGLYACSGILFNHESPLRPTRFVTRKIVAGACEIASGRLDRLQLGNLSIHRDWGWAPDYVDAMWRMLQQGRADDYVIATGETHSLKEFLAFVFDQLNLRWQDWVVFDKKMQRPTDIILSHADARKAAEYLDWHAENKMHDVINQMVKAELEQTEHKR